MRYIFFTFVIFFLATNNAHAYVGPGIGLGAIGAIIGVIASVFLAIVGFIWYPAKRFFSKKKKKNSDNTE